MLMHLLLQSVHAAPETDRVMAILRKVTVPRVEAAALLAAFPEPPHHVIKLPVFIRPGACPLRQVSRHVKHAEVPPAVGFAARFTRCSVVGDARV
jgi:hypothetical protein